MSSNAPRDCFGGVSRALSRQAEFGKVLRMFRGVLVVVILGLLASSWVKAGHEFEHHQHPASLEISAPVNSELLATSMDPEHVTNSNCIDGVCQVCAALGTACVAPTAQPVVLTAQLFLSPRWHTHALRLDPLLPQDDPPPR